MSEKLKSYPNPKFTSLEEERKYWEVHGPLAEGYKGKIQRSSQKRSSFLAVRLTGEELTSLRDVAAKQGLGPSTFARMVLTAAIEQASKMPKSKTLDEVMEALEKNLPQEMKERMEAILNAIAIGEPPYLLELTDKKKLEEFAYLTTAALLSTAGVQVVTPKDKRHEEVKEVVKAQA